MNDEVNARCGRPRRVDLEARDSDALCSCTTRIGREEHAVVTRQLCMPMLAASVSPVSCTLHRMHAELNTERANELLPRFPDARYLQHAKTTWFFVAR